MISWRKNVKNVYYCIQKSVYYEIDEEFYEIMHQHKEFFDLSNQPKDSKYYCNDNN